MAGDMTNKYWQDGTAIVEKERKETIEKALSEQWYSHAPIGMSLDQAKGYHAGRIDALQYALEMMGYYPNG